MKKDENPNKKANKEPIENDIDEILRETVEKPVINKSDNSI